MTFIKTFLLGHNTKIKQRLKKDFVYEPKADIFESLFYDFICFWRKIYFFILFIVISEINSHELGCNKLF